MLEDGLYDDFKFFIEQIIECQIILNDLTDETEEICNSKKITEQNTKERFENNLQYMEIIDEYLNKIKEKCKKIIFQNDAVNNTIQLPILKNKNLIRFPSNKNDDIYVDLDYPIPLKDYLDKDKI